MGFHSLIKIKRYAPIVIYVFCFVLLLNVLSFVFYTFLFLIIGFLKHFKKGFITPTLRKKKNNFLLHVKTCERFYILQDINIINSLETPLKLWKKLIKKK